MASNSTLTGRVRSCAGKILIGSHAPAHVPAKRFWAVTLYELETCSFIRDVASVGVDSYDQKMRRNDDGSVDLYFGPKDPSGRENNWHSYRPR